jgi:RNA polymerase sigma factor (sigma-70 family)
VAINPEPGKAIQDPLAISSVRMSDAFVDYMKTIRGIPLLTPAEELHLGTLVRAWLSEPQPGQALERRGRRALQRMTSANLRLVVSLCLRQQRRILHLGIDTMDLVQAGNLGLLQAAERFDPTRGYRFSTYGYWWINQSIQKHLHDHAHLIRVPNQILELASRARDLQNRSLVPLSSERLAASLGESKRRVEQALAAQQHVQLISLDQSAGGADDRPRLIDNVSDGRELQAEEDYLWLHRQLELLNGRERQVIELRFFREQQESLAGVARITGLSKYQVQRTEVQALRKLRQRITPAEPQLKEVAR